MADLEKIYINFTGVFTSGYNLAMNRKPDLSYVADLTRRLMKARADVKVLQAEWDALWTGNAAEAAPTQSTRKQRQGTKLSKIIQFLHDRPDQSFTSEQVNEELNLGNATSTATTLSKLVKSGKISKKGNGQYTWPTESDGDKLNVKEE
jgi:hypothetical protein